MNIAVWTVFTDVLSFPALPHGIEEEEAALGDLVIALPLTMRRAGAAGRAVMDELRLLVAHARCICWGTAMRRKQRAQRCGRRRRRCCGELGLPPDLAGQLEQGGLQAETG